MSLIIELPPAVEKELQQEAAEKGLDAPGLVREILLQRSGRVEGSPGNLPLRECELLNAINEGPGPAVWERYRELKSKRQAETLTSEEHSELISLFDEIEMAHSRRLEHLLQLSRLRRVDLSTLMTQLGINSPPHE